MSFKFNAILKFNATGATRSMKLAGRGFQQMGRNIKRASASMAKMNQGLRGLAIAGLPAAAGVAFATKTFGDFEFQMKTVQSVLLATNDEMKGLTNQAKLMGATTEFSAIQASEGQEALARSGLNTKEIMSALPGVMAAASAASVDLGSATDIVVGQLGAFGLEGKDAARVADAMALTTALTNTNFTQLGEAMKLAAPELKGVNISIEETASSIGVLANAGIKGSLAGTAIKNAFVKLSKPTKKAVALFGGRAGFNAALLEIGENGEKKLRPMEVIMANISEKAAKMKNPLDRAAFASEIFGLRGKAALSSFTSALGKNTIVTEKNIGALIKGAKKVGSKIPIELGKPIPKLVALRLQIAGATGTAQKMRDIKLDSLNGQIILLKSAFEGINIELGSIFAGITRNLIGKTTRFLSTLTVAFQAAKNGGKATDEMLKTLGTTQKAMLPGLIEFAQGFIEGFDEIVATGKRTFRAIMEFLEPIIGSSKLTSKEIGSIVAKIVVVGAVAAPILGGLAAAFFVLGPIIAGISGAISFMGAVFGIVVGAIKIGIGLIGGLFFLLTSPIGLTVLAIGAIGIAIAGIREKWTEIKAAFLDGEILKGFKLIGDGILKFLEGPLNAVKEKWEGIKSFFGFGAGKTDSARQPERAGGLDIDAVNDSVQIQKESVTQKAITQPPSADQLREFQINKASGSGDTGAAGGGGGTQKLELSFKGDAKKIFNKMVTKSAVENSQLQGKNTLGKRQKLANGFAL